MDHAEEGEDGEEGEGGEAGFKVYGEEEEGGFLKTAKAGMGAIMHILTAIQRGAKAFQCWR